MPLATLNRLPLASPTISWDQNSSNAAAAPSTETALNASSQISVIVMVIRKSLDVRSDRGCRTHFLRPDSERQPTGYDPHPPGPLVLKRLRTY
jgi:hypothetical protein